MSRDRCDYRAMSAGALLDEAREVGLNDELAIAIADKLAEHLFQRNRVGTFHFNRSTK